MLRYYAFSKTVLGKGGPKGQLISTITSHYTGINISRTSIVIHCQRDERKHEIAEQHIQTEPTFRGIFCILVGRSPAPVFEVKRFANGGMDITKKTPQPYVNQYSFHIMDHEWGHLVIKLCPHPPFTAQIMLNGHEYVDISFLSVKQDQNLRIILKLIFITKTSK